MSIVVAGKAVSHLRLWIFGISTTIIIVGIYLQVKCLYELSQPLVKEGFFGADQGWLTDGPMDLSDFQWREWRHKKWLLLFTMGPFLIISFIMRTLATFRGWKPQVQVWFYAVVGLVGCWIMHGSGTVWILSILFGNYIIGRLLEPVPENVAVFLLWVYNAGALTLNHMSYFASIGFFFPAFGFLDHYRGLMPWEVYFKMAMLRLVSYAIDYQIAYRQKINKRNEALEVDSQAKQTRRERQETADLNLFGLVPLIAYTLYLPLYLAGPIATFSSFARSCELRQKTVPLPEILKMLLKVALYWIGLDIFLHYIYVYSWNVIGDWEKYSPGILSLICYWTLNFMFMKLMIIWRTFRAIALLDGIYTPENMKKCISNSNTFQGFWRAWHASFSEWLVRYIYVPMGGRKRRVISLWLIFFFVGAWHEFNTKWMAFAFFNAFGISIETIIKSWVYRSGQKWISTSRSSWPIRSLEVLVAAMNLSLLILANFAINQGFDKTFSFFYFAFMKNTESHVNAVKTFGFLVVASTCFYSNPWNKENPDNAPEGSKQPLDEEDTPAQKHDDTV